MRNQRVDSQRWIDKLAGSGFTELNRIGQVALAIFRLGLTWSFLMAEEAEAS